MISNYGGEGPKAAAWAGKCLRKVQIPDVKCLKGWSGSVAGLGGMAKAWVGCRAQLEDGSQLGTLSRLRCLSYVCPLLHGALQSLCLLLVYLHIVHLLIGCDGGRGGLWERWDAVSDWEGVGVHPRILWVDHGASNVFLSVASNAGALQHHPSWKHQSLPATLQFHLPSLTHRGHAPPGTQLGLSQQPSSWFSWEYTQPQARQPLLLLS